MRGTHQCTDSPCQWALPWCLLAHWAVDLAGPKARPCGFCRQPDSGSVSIIPPWRTKTDAGSSGLQGLLVALHPPPQCLTAHPTCQVSIQIEPHFARLLVAAVLDCRLLLWHYKLHDVLFPQLPSITAGNRFLTTAHLVNQRLSLPRL